MTHNGFCSLKKNVVKKITDRWFGAAQYALTFV